jgi:membrane-associated protease RseP (regulator of RpoE activity)
LEYFLKRPAATNRMNENNQAQLKKSSGVVVDIMSPDEVDEPLSLHKFHAPNRRLGISILLFIATCLSTFFVSAFYSSGNSVSEKIEDGFLYCIPLMIILVFHEMGHFYQSYRLGVFSTWPLFIPVPIPPFGTMGAVIFMEPRMGHRRALFDIGISGPLAGLVPTIIFCIIGILLSSYEPDSTATIHHPLLFKWLTVILRNDIPTGCVIKPNAIAFAGWVGLLITSLNLIPIGQLDGGHVLYALLKDKAHYVATSLLVVALLAVIRFHYEGWSLMLTVLILMGPQHPPTADDNERLGLFRYILGWLTLAFVLIGFTPKPF